MQLSVEPQFSRRVAGGEGGKRELEHLLFQLCTSSPPPPPLHSLNPGYAAGSCMLQLQLAYMFANKQQIKETTVVQVSSINKVTTCGLATLFIFPPFCRDYR